MKYELDLVKELGLSIKADGSRLPVLTVTPYGWLTLVIVFMVALLGYVAETYKEYLPQLTALQSWAYLAPAGFSARFFGGLPCSPQAGGDTCVTLLLIDENLYYRPDTIIESKTHGGCSLHPGPPVSRLVLADLLKSTSQAQPAVIGLDINLSAAADDIRRQCEDRELLAEIRQVNAAGIPVVLTVGLVPAAQHPNQWKELANFYCPAELRGSAAKVTPPTYPAGDILASGSSEEGRLPCPPNVSSWMEGFDNGPREYLRLPLAKVVVETGVPTETGPKLVPSFALQLASAYSCNSKFPNQRGSCILDQLLIQEAIRTQEFLLGAFRKWTLPDPPVMVSESAKSPTRIHGQPKPTTQFKDSYVHQPFHTIWAADLVKCIGHERQPNCKEMWQALRERIVIIGAAIQIPGTTKHFDEHESPFSDCEAHIPLRGCPKLGVYFHANYVESLLEHKMKRPAAGWMAFLIDCVLGLGLCYLFRLHLGIRGQSMVKLLLAVVCLGMLWLIYVLGTTMRSPKTHDPWLPYSLDFILPLVLLIVGLLVEHYWDLRKAASVHGGG